VAIDQILSVCSGIGGLDLGLHDGLRAVGRTPRTVCMVEREAFCVATLVAQMRARRLDESPVWLGDLRDLPVQELPAIDWITGGYPCQPFSAAGRRLGEEDPRHLWPVILDLVRTLRPRGVFFENVSGHLTLGLDRVLRDLAESGFRSAFGLFTAEEVGAPHRRERVFILGMADADHEQSEESKGDDRLDLERSKIGRRELLASRSRADGGDGRGDPSEGTGGNDSGAGLAGNEGCLADAGCARSSNRIPEKTVREGTEESRDDRPRWPTRPGEDQHEWEPPRTIESDVGRGVDGIPSRVDRLRALGNAVVPAQAERAFVTLYREVAGC
jgi:DNA (cytosine-5)-methyltransferase 1